jgi:hypothetical protein
VPSTSNSKTDSQAATSSTRKKKGK